MALTADEVTQVKFFVTTVNHAKENTHNDCEGGRGHTQVYMTKRWNRQKRRKLPMVVKADGVL